MIQVKQALLVGHDCSMSRVLVDCSELEGERLAWGNLKAAVLSWRWYLSSSALTYRKTAVPATWRHVSAGRVIYTRHGGASATIHHRDDIKHRCEVASPANAGLSWCQVSIGRTCSYGPNLKFRNSTSFFILSC